MPLTEHRLYGPPGVGKTTELTRLIGKIVAERGPDSLLVTSFTKAAAITLAQKNEDVDEKHLGTLHSICFHALGQPKIAETHIKEFNEAYPHFAISGGTRSDPDDPYGGGEVSEGSTSADVLFSEMQILRARMVPQLGWPTPVQAFAAAWTEWKYLNDYVDFQGFIEKCYTDVEYAPGTPEIAILDEAQDTTKLEMSLLRKWAEHMDYMMVAFDDDQLLYHFVGARVETLLNPSIPDAQKHYLTESKRVPRAVHATSQAWIQQVSLREPKAYLPRDCEGEVRVNVNPRLTWKNPELVLEDAQPYLDAGKSVMFLASCAFMLDPLKHALRAAALPFHNPYRRKRGDWNPLHASNGVSTAQRLLAYLAPLPGVGGDAWTGTWTHRDVALFGSLLEAKGTFKHGMKDTLKMWASDYAPMTPADWTALFLDDIVAPDFLFDDDEEIYAWLEARMLPSKKAALAFPLEIARKRSHVALAETPQIILGSVHCSPGDEPVFTTNRGYVPIKDLMPDWDHVLSYDSTTNHLCFGSYHGKLANGYKITAMSQHYYEGTMLHLVTDKSRTRVTPNHLIQAKFNETFYEKWMVYLMEKDGWWRVGICTTAHRPYRSGGLPGRLATEQGDGGWILGIYHTRKEALISEATIQGKYGIPGLTFRSSKDRSLDTIDLQRIHAAVSENVHHRALQLLSDFGLCEECPLYKRTTPGTEDVKKNLSGMFLTYAANIISGYMDIPVAPLGFLQGKKNLREKPLWCKVTVNKEQFSGDVYSIDVDKWHHYVSGGAIVHNSVKGGEADCCYLFPDVSRAGMREYLTAGEPRDSVYRLMYVGMTRAKESLILCAPSSNLSVRW